MTETKADPIGSVAVVGRGRVGHALSEALREKGVDVRLVPGRGGASATVDIAVLAVPDVNVQAVATHWGDAGCVLHCAGALGFDAFGALDRPGLGAWHPLLSFCSEDARPQIEGAMFAIAGDARALAAASALSERLGAGVLREVGGPAYHAAAALTAGGAAALVSVGVRILKRLGVSQRDAERGLGALLRSVADNIVLVGLPDALTGPVARGDAKTVRAHRRVLEPEERAAYDAFGPAIIQVARQGLDPASEQALHAAFQDEELE